jgi:hypothetical protein
VRQRRRQPGEDAHADVVLHAQPFGHLARPRHRHEDEVRRRRRRRQAQRAQPLLQRRALRDREPRVRLHPAPRVVRIGQRRQRAALGRVRDLERPARLLDLAHDARVADAVAHAQPRQPERLAHRAQREHAPHPRRLGREHLRARLGIGQHVLGVGLVDEHQSTRARHHAPHRLARHRRRRRIVGRAQVDDGRVGRQQRLGVDRVVVARQRHRDRLHPVRACIHRHHRERRRRMRHHPALLRERPQRAVDHVVRSAPGDDLAGRHAGVRRQRRLQLGVVERRVVRDRLHGRRLHGSECRRRRPPQVDRVAEVGRAGRGPGE